jgi:ethanolamine ammonia-lyase large subunit
MDNLLVLMGTAGCNFIMGVPGTDDIMLNYQSTSFHDALFIRKLLKLKPAPEFENWLMKNGWMNENGTMLSLANAHPMLQYIQS